LETAKYLAKNSLGVIDNISCIYDDVIQEEIEKINIIKLVDDIKQNYSMKIQVQDLRFNIKIDSKIKYIYTDRSKLFQVLSNLFSNAIKYSPRSETINLIVRKYKGKIHFIFENNKLSKDEMQKVKSSKIGLKVVKKLADNMKWKLTISDKEKYKIAVSVIDKGAVVNYTSNHIYHMINNKSVLLVEDDIISSKLTEALLAKFVKEIDVIDELEKINKKKKYDIIISDMNLKIKNDFSHIKILKNKYKPEKLIAISADNLEDIALREGADYFYKKPLSVRLFDNNVRIVNLEMIKENEKLYGKEVLSGLYKEFILYSKAKIEDARMNIFNKNYLFVRNIFHSLKSASLTFGMVEFSNYCKLIEDIDDIFITRSRIEELEEILYSSRDFIEVFRPKYLIKESLFDDKK